MKKKILLLVGLCFILGMVLVGCGGSSSNIYGTWEYDHGEIDGSTYTIKELQAMEPDLFYDDVFFVIKEGGSVFYYENGQSYNQDWSQTEDTYHIGNMDATLTKDGLLKAEIGDGNYIYLKRVSSSQEIPDIKEKATKEEPEEEATTEDSKDEEKEDTTTNNTQKKDAATEKEDFEDEWPTDGIAKNLPDGDTPVRSIMKLDDSVSFDAYCEKPEDFKAYVKKVKDAGFTDEMVDFTDDGNFYGKNDKCTISIMYFEDDYYYYVTLYENVE